MTSLFKSIVKRPVIRALRHGPVLRLLLGTLRDRCVILMLHRFRCPDRGVSGHDPEDVRSTLSRLRGEKRAILSLRDVFARLGGDGAPLAGEVCFTIDDGYADHAEVAAPIFAEFDCPVTTFVATGFLDREMWYWWDRIKYAVQNSPKNRARVDGLDRQLWITLGDAGDRARETRRIVEHCKGYDPERREELIAHLASSLEVEIPSFAPERYAPMSWSDVAACEKGGMKFGPHTVTHPILDRCSDLVSEAEIRGSWARLCEMTTDPEPIFCYPNGQLGDFGAREFQTLEALGMLGAVSGSPAYASSQRFTADPDYRFRAPRFAYVGADENAQVFSGLARIKQWLRGAGS